MVEQRFVQPDQMWLKVPELGKGRHAGGAAKHWPLFQDAML